MDDIERGNSQKEMSLFTSLVMMTCADRKSATRYLSDMGQKSIELTSSLCLAIQTKELA